LAGDCEEIEMGQLQHAYELHALPGPRPLLAALLYGAARMLAAAAERLAVRAAQPAAQRHREFEVIERDGQLVGMIYEDGRLVALLPEVGRL
jgi:hypothetical protein